MDDVDLVRSIYARWARRDAAGDLLHPDVQWSMPYPGGQVRGRVAAVEFLATFIGTWTDHRIELEEVRSVGPGRVLSLFTERAVGRGSGVPIEGHPGALWTIENGLVTRFEGFTDRDEALRQAGTA